VGLYEWFWASLHEAPCSRLGTRFLLLLMALSSVLFTVDASAQLGAMVIAAWAMSLLRIVWSVLPTSDVSWASVVGAQAPAAGRTGGGRGRGGGGRRCNGMGPGSINSPQAGL
jgi:hypothetical protein